MQRCREAEHSLTLLSLASLPQCNLPPKLQGPLSIPAEEWGFGNEAQSALQDPPLECGGPRTQKDLAMLQRDFFCSCKALGARECG